MNQEISRIALAWFKREEWDDIRRICPDLHDTYDEWLVSVQKTIDELGSLNADLVKVVLTASELRKWQRATGRKVDGRVRSHLAAKRAGQANTEQT
ncbi:hypothetical protein [Bradyrhizobium sp. HKCCYLS20291]|uniref:hypothetical protein n=1 Tax=Bradyrhizobium sp. HKCCYLS20291 TaxID=3420766 RepID=UPI003EBBB1BB